jgi:hypothetical protein
MLHDDAQRLLPELADGALHGERERQLRRHIERCGDCRSWLETYSLLAEGLGGATEHPTSEQLARLAVDGAVLTASEIEALSEHLESCRDCRRQVELASASLAEPGEHRGVGQAAWKRWLAPGVAVRVAAAAVLALAVGIGFDARRAREAPEPRQLVVSEAADRELAGEVLQGVQVIETAGSISAREMTVERGVDLTLRAPGGVVLGNGFSVGEGGSLKIENVAAAGEGSNKGESA